MHTFFLSGLLAETATALADATATAAQHPNWKAFPALLIYVGLALGISFLCSILEATLLSTRVTELAERRSKGDSGAALMLNLKEKRVEDAISAILTLNTIAHTIGAALAGAQADKVWGSKWVAPRSSPRPWARCTRRS
ncbi:MAG: CNNM domain-containing protein [Planctomycetota bacterium]|jgi:CBS domain containing-hemolysin-like protein